MEHVPPALLKGQVLDSTCRCAVARALQCGASMTRFLLASTLVAAAVAALTVLTTSPAPSSRSSAADATQPRSATEARATARASATRPRLRPTQPALPVADEPVVDAEEPPPPLPKTAAEERALIQQRLGQSGHTADAWSRDASVAIDAVAQRLGADGVRLGATECFQGGCIVAVSYADLAAYDEALAVFSDHEALQAWSRAITGPEHGDGRVTNALVLFPPESPTTANL